MNTKISEEKVEAIRSELEIAGKGLWSDLYMELQDDGDCLFISVEIPKYCSPQEMSQISKLIKSIIEPKIPIITLENKDYYPTYSAGLKIDGKVVYGIFHSSID